MPSNRVDCPHCGHDGTMETSRPPLGSYGFNYLAEGVGGPAEKSVDDGARVRLLGDVRVEASEGSSARLECRSCWRTFPVPEGLQWAVVPVSVPDLEDRPAAAAADIPTPDTMEAAATAITRSLVVVLRSIVHDADQAGAPRMAQHDAELAALREQASSAAMAQEMWLGRIAAVEAAVRAQQTKHQEILELAGALDEQNLRTLRRLEDQGQAIVGLKDQTGEFRQAAASGLEGLAARVSGLEGTLADEKSVREITAAGLDALTTRVTSLDGLPERMMGLEESLRAEREGADQLRAVCTQLQAENQSLQQRLDAQAAVIRALHGAAIEQTTRREELRAAVQRLEELTSSASLMHPLPERL